MRGRRRETVMLVRLRPDGMVVVTRVVYNPDRRL